EPQRPGEPEEEESLGGAVLAHQKERFLSGECGEEGWFDGVVADDAEGAEEGAGFCGARWVGVVAERLLLALFVFAGAVGALACAGGVRAALACGARGHREVAPRASSARGGVPAWPRRYRGPL